MKFALQILMLATFVSLAGYGQQSDKPPSRAEKPAPSSASTPQTSGEQPAQPQPQRVQPESPAQQRTSETAGEEGSLRPMHFDMTEVPPVQTHHEIHLNGKLLRYTATAGRLPIKDAEGKIQAEMFFVAYTLDDTDPSTRPVTFAFNGGPGSASIWLHMGALGPRKVVLQPDGWLPESPYHLMDNPNTPLDKTDLVLVDAIGTGYSRPADTAAARRYWSLRGDIESFGEFIRMYLSRYERWLSPHYLFGESYGTTRSAGIAGYLADRGISFNGIVLLSTVLNFETLDFAKTNDVPYPLYLPTFASIAAYHHKLAPELTQDLNHTREEAAQWARGEYSQALAKGDALTPEERQSIIDKLARYTGLSKDVIDQANLRIDVRTFTRYLLADQKLVVGRYDGRFTGPDPNGFFDTPFYDPTNSQIGPPFTSTFNDYIRRELNYKVDMPYYNSARNSGFFQWNWTGGPPPQGSSAPTSDMGYADTATALRQAIVKDRFLKVLVMEGYYDLATPFMAVDYTMNHLDLTPEYHKNISTATYDSGHMVYLNSAAHPKMKQDFANFIDATLPKAH
ncbi:MAG TPA: hypothetical protein VK738_00515 [Terriglobales bacterium]|nr:hypothetical protein [Terriglobales bacterium]